MKHIAATVALCLLAATAQAQYKWTDANGRVNYGDAPPPDARNVERVRARGGDVSATATLPFELRRAAETFPVVLYTSSACGGPCENARQLLQTRGVPFSERVIATREDLEELKRRGLGEDVPTVTVGRETQRGFEAGTWQRLLDSAGYPRSSQLPPGWTNPAARPLVEPQPAAAAN